MKEYRYWVEVTWNGRTTRIFGSDDRLILDKYVASCDRNLDIRVVDTLEEEVNHGRRNRSR